MVWDGRNGFEQGAEIAFFALLNVVFGQLPEDGKDGFEVWGRGKLGLAVRGRFASEHDSAVTGSSPAIGFKHATAELVVRNTVGDKDFGGCGGAFIEKMDVLLSGKGGKVSVPPVGDSFLTGFTGRWAAGDRVAAPEVSVGPDEVIAGDDGSDFPGSGCAEDWQRYPFRIVGRNVGIVGHWDGSWRFKEVRR